MCAHCKKNYNVANINIPATATSPAIQMPPLDAPLECQPHLEIRSDDNLATVQHRLEVCASQLDRAWHMEVCLLLSLS